MNVEKKLTLVALKRIKNQDFRDKCIKILDYLEKEYQFSEKPAAKKHHHNYRGGLDVHTSEVIEFSLELNKLAGKPYDEDEVIVVAFLHDLEKAYMYNFTSTMINAPCSGEAIVFRLCAKFGLVLSFRMVSAIEFAHGGYSIQAHNTHLQPSSLFVILSSADMMSAYFGKIGDNSLNRERTQGASKPDLNQEVIEKNMLENLRYKVDEIKSSLGIGAKKDV